MANYTKKETNLAGNVFYYNDKDQLHRLDGPAIEGDNDSKMWFVDGKRHRLDGPAIEYADGSKEWWLDGKLHRLDGPAIEWSSGSKSWYVDGKRHRLDGPAVEGANGGKEWWVNDKSLTEEQFNKHPLVVEKTINKLIGEVLEET